MCRSLRSTTFVIICGLDSLYHGQLTITPLNFVFTNLSSVSLFYGSSPWHYYLTQGLPILCTTALPFALHGMWLASGSAGSPPSKLLLGLLLWTISIYSLAGHKEWRFIHPLLPVLHMFAAKSLVDLSNRRNSAQPQGKDRTRTILPISKTYLSLLVFNLVPLVYLVFFHSRAQIDVMHYLRSLNESEVHSVGFLMPCHSTPWHAYLHKPTWADGHRFWALGCEPPLGYVSLFNMFVYRLTQSLPEANPFKIIRTKRMFSTRPRSPTYTTVSHPKSTHPSHRPLVPTRNLESLLGRAHTTGDTNGRSIWSCSGQW